MSVRPSRATPEPVQPQHISAFTRLRGLLEVTRLVRTDDELDHLLAAVARTTAESLGFGTVVLNIYRPAWDDFCTTTVHGSDAARELLLGDARGWDVWGRVLADRFALRGAYFVPHGTFDWEELAPRSYVPELPRTSVPGAWHPEDSLMVPMRHSDGHLLGIMSVDEPVSGQRPSDDEIDVLVALAAHAALAIQSAQEMAESARHRSALEQLLRVSSRLTETVTVGAVLQAVCDGIHTALGFESVCVDLPNPETFGEYRLTYRTGDILSPQIAAAEPLYLEMSDFCKAIRTAEAPRSSAELGLEVVRIIEAVDASLAADGSRVAVDDVLPSLAS